MPPAKGKRVDAAAGFGLQILTGSQTGREIALHAGHDWVIGRGKTADVPIVDTSISRAHCKLFFDGDQLRIEDLNSANGTFVNSKRLGSGGLKHGDTIRIGKSRFKIVPAAGIGADAREWWSQSAAELNDAEATEQLAVEAQMSGRLESVPLADLLQLLSNAMKSGTLTVKSNRNLGKLHLRDGSVFLASINGKTSLDPHKTLFRILGWRKGGFDLGAPEDVAAGTEIQQSITGLLLEAAQENDLLAELADRLPDLRSRLKLANPLPGALRGLSPAELDLIQLTHEHGVFLDLLDRFSGTDLEACQLLMGLIDGNWILPGKD